MRSISACESRPFSFVMTIWFDLPVDLSWPLTDKMPLASRSNVTSIWGTPLGAGGMPPRRNSPRKLLSLAIARSPSKTRITTSGWLSAKVVKVCLALVGMVVFRPTSFVITPFAPSSPSERGVTSSRSRSCTCADPPSVRMAACTAAPWATASSQLTDLERSLPPKKSCTMFLTMGIRADPPTSTTSWTSCLPTPLSCNTRSTQARDFLM
mmetsp:Transcript_56878/g.160538  ORF Transcript_56878/g.160538 Transcript_56878/m.160538 type:complete len:210 (+) Transcript_56878:487-1116(+)